MAASNYDLRLMAAGILILSVSGGIALYSITPISQQVQIHAWALLFLAIYCSLMFASSYVEEEHQFWYWTGSAFCFYIFLKE